MKRPIRPPERRSIRPSTGRPVTPTLYKFIADPDIVRHVLSGIVKFTPIPELNDPLELIPNVIPKEVKASLIRLRRNGYTEEDAFHLQQQGNLLRLLAPHFLAIDVPLTKEQATTVIRSPFYDLMPVLEELLGATAQEMSSKVGLLCLSQRYDSLPMWAHYAANAFGLVVEFRGLDHVFVGDDTGVLRQPVAVRYERESVGVTFDPRSHESLFFAKFQDWSYEQEVRVVLPLTNCRQQFMDKKLLHLYEVPLDCIARLILGWNMVPEKIKAVQDYARAINPEVEVVQARIVRGHD